MADFPSKVDTETSPAKTPAPNEGSSLRGLATEVEGMLDMSFIRSIPGLLIIAEIVLGLLQWALIASAFYTLVSAYGWVMFVAVTLWILTTALFLILLFGVPRKYPVIPWPTVVMGYQGIATVLYLTAFLANAASVRPFYLTLYYGHMAAAAFFGAVVTLSYGASFYFSYLDWKGESGIAEDTTPPATQ